LFSKNNLRKKHRYIENTKKIGFIAFIADTLWLSPPYHENAYHGKIWPVLIIIEHRQFFRGLISTVLLERWGGSASYTLV